MTNNKSTKIIAYLILFLLFAFATPYDLFYTIREIPTVNDRILDATEGSSSRRVALACLACFAVMTMVRSRQRNFQINGVLGYLFTSFIIWTLLSIFWSEDMYYTLRKLCVFVILIYTAITLAENFSFKNIIEFTFIACCLTLIISIASEIVLGTFHPGQENYLFSGVMHPNSQGENCGILLISSIALSSIEKRWRYVFHFVGTLAFIFLFLTKSRTGFWTAILAIMIYYFLLKIWRHKLISLYCILLSIFIIFFACEYSGSSTKTALFLGRDTSEAGTLTNRTPLWSDCLRDWMKNPILGYGYDSFWNAKNLSIYAQTQDWAVPHSHNGYIELALGLGIVGVSLYIFALILAIKKSISLFNITGSIEYAAISVLIIRQSLNMLFEVNLFWPFIPTFIGLVILMKLCFVDINNN